MEKPKQIWFCMYYSVSRCDNGCLCFSVFQRFLCEELRILKEGRNASVARPACIEELT